MLETTLSRRGLMMSAGAIVASAAIPSRIAAAAQDELGPVKLPPPISNEERLARLAKARDLMQRNGIGAVLVESGPSLDYYTGIHFELFVAGAGRAAGAGGRYDELMGRFGRPMPAVGVSLDLDTIAEVAV